MPASLYNFGMNKLPEDIKDIINKFDQEHGHMVSYKWYNPEFTKEDLVRKVRAGEIFIWGMKMDEQGFIIEKEKHVTFLTFNGSNFIIKSNIKTAFNILIINK